jgi:hypothetical protein
MAFVSFTEVVRSFIPGECLRYLTRNPFGRGICCDVDPIPGQAACGLQPRYMELSKESPRRRF